MKKYYGQAIVEIDARDKYQAEALLAQLTDVPGVHIIGREVYTQEVADDGKKEQVR